MNNEDKIMAICWLDSGHYQTRSVASRYHMSDMELEAELATFKNLPAYVKDYADYVHEHTRESLSGCPFPSWKRDLTVRVLKNNRIECIMCETGTDKYFHFHLPGKSYLDTIYSHTKWMSAEAFNRELVVRKVKDWTALSATDQLTFLVQRYDSDIFLPFCHRIDSLQFVQLTGQRYPGDPEWYMSTQGRQFQTLASSNELSHGSVPVKSLPNGDLDRESRALRNNQITALTKLISSYCFSYEWEGKEEEVELDESDFNSIQGLLLESDSTRLQVLAAKGPKQVEQDLLYINDEFYGFYGLLQAFESGLATHDFSELKQTAQAAFDRISEDYKARTGSTSSGIRQEAVNNAGQENLHDTLWQLFDAVCEASTDEVDQTFNDLGSVLSGLDDNGRSEALRIFESEFMGKMNSESRERTRSLLSARPGTTPTVAGRSVVPDSQSGGYTSQMIGLAGNTGSVVNDAFVELMNTRKILLDGIRAKGMTEELVNDFIRTEKVILKLKSGNRPANYPERDVTLYKLYFSGKMHTEIAVLKEVTARMTPSEINEIYNF